MKIAVYIGRQQITHLGHIHVMETAIKSGKYDQIYILIGSAFQSRSKKNPLSYARRKQIIDGYLKTVDPNFESWIFVKPIPDHPSNDAWIASVQSAVPHNPLSDEVFILGSDKDETTDYLKWFKNFKFDLTEPFKIDGSVIHATDIRERIYLSKRLNNCVHLDSIKNWLHETTFKILQDQIYCGVWDEIFEDVKYADEYKRLWNNTPYPVQFVTADAVIIQSGHVLLIQRGNLPGRGLLAIPGGFVNQNERIIDAAIREAIEETGIQLTTGKRSLEVTKQILRGSIQKQQVFDEPKRSDRGRIITHAFVMHLDDTKPLPQVSGQNVPEYESNGEVEVETLGAFWMPFSEVITRREEFFEDHFSILQWALNL